MKRLLIKVTCIALCLTFIFLATSCQQKSNSNEATPVIPDIEEQWSNLILLSDPSGVTYSYYFETVEDLLTAIKHNPNKYNNARVKVIGTIYKDSDETLLVDFTMTSTNIPSVSSNSSGLLAGVEFRRTLRSSKNQINIIITNDAQYSVAEIGDYVKIYGTVKLDRNNIYISCEYDLIATLEERRQNINDQK